GSTSCGDATVDHSTVGALSENARLLGLHLDPIMPRNTAKGGAKASAKAAARKAHAKSSKRCSKSSALKEATK
ncbi:hypothetical protein L916_04348, partial [Phytophthora nicotianae]